MVSCNHILHSWMPRCLLPMVPTTLPCHEVNAIAMVLIFLFIDNITHSVCNLLSFLIASTSFCLQHMFTGMRVPSNLGGFSSSTW
jgi:hypothetical protein